jgi:hypothetical protein
MQVEYISQRTKSLILRKKKIRMTMKKKRKMKKVKRLKKVMMIMKVNQ